MFGVGIHAILFCTPLIRHLVVVMFTAFTNPLTSRCRNRSVMLTFGIQTHYEAIVQLNKFLHKIYFIGRFFSRSTPINPMNSIDLNCVIIAGGLYHMFQCFSVDTFLVSNYIVKIADIRNWWDGRKVWDDICILCLHVCLCSWTNSTHTAVQVN